ncbi:hypothetical protein [Streptomyces mirabilis]|uniref:hypothetical protein n=1 Tax=Streptomyces mirabilis TaxID=68239 RepID=UPI0036D8F057
MGRLIRNRTGVVDEGGKPCYLVGDGTGYLSRVADTVESVQLAMSAALLDHAADMLDDHKVTATQLRFLAARMAEALRDVHRIAESRGARLPLPAQDSPGGPDGLESEDEDEDEDLRDRCPRSGFGLG